MLKQLNVTLAELKALVAEGVLSYKSLPSITGITEFGFVRQREIDGMLEKLNTFAIDDLARTEATVEFGRLKHHVGPAIKLLFSGQLPKSRWVFPERGLDGLQLNYREWMAAKARIPTERMNHRQVMDLLRVDRETVHRLVAARKLTREPIKAGSAYLFYSRHQVEAFLQLYAPISKLVTITGSNRLGVEKWIRIKKITQRSQ